MSEEPTPRKRVDTGDSARRSKFKDRGKELERGISAPALLLKGKAPLAPLPLTEEEALSVGHGLGHDFKKKTFYQPTYCHHCAELLWGIKGQGFTCTVCNLISHEKCIPNLMVPCRHVLAECIQDPVAHKWTKPMTFKKKVHCNVCRKRILGQGVICEVCKYYSHVRCKDNAFNNCKLVATYTSDKLAEDCHHWIEGNLPSSARCEVCTRNCSTTECLSAFRCGWCGIAVHSACRGVIDLKESSSRECTYRDLWHMILLPRAITHRLAIKTHMEQEANTPTGDDQEEAEGEEEADEEEPGGKGRPCLVIDGRGKKEFQKWRKTTVHPMYISKKTTAAELLLINLRKCGISDDPSLYYLVEVTSVAKGVERELAPSECPYNIQPGGHGPLRLYIRHKPHEMVRSKLKVKNGQLLSTIKQVTVSITSATTTAAEIVNQALIKFDLLDSDPADYCLVEVSQVVGVRERMVDDNECPGQHLQDLRKDSLTLCNLQRYYLCHREGGQTAIFIGGIKKDILKDKQKYTDHIKTLLSEAPAQLLPKNIPYDRINIGPAFPIMGGVFLKLPTFELAMKITLALEQTPSSPKVIMLPTVYPDIVGMNQEPLLVFVNGKSGGNQGVQLLWAFRRHLNPHQVYDLANGGPLPGLYAFRDIPQFRILIGGGDGTFGWVLGALQEIKDHMKCKDPPCALLPLGTGNDLARALKWGGGYSGEKVMQILLSVEDANICYLDRWEMTFTEDPSVVPGGKKAGAKPILEPHTVVMNNYFGVGLDAAIALDFHIAREENPEKFSSRFHNKSVYLQLGLQKMIAKKETSELRNYINIFVDKKKVDLPELEGVVILNIQSWGAGADAWGSTQDPNYQPASCDDGLLEVFGISGVMHCGQVQSGIRSGIRLAQGSELRLEFLTTLPVQVDGEAWPQPPGYLTVTKLPTQAKMLLGTEKAHYSRSLSKKETVLKIEHSKLLAEPEVHLSGGMSSRRRAQPFGAMSMPEGDY